MSDDIRNDARGILNSLGSVLNGIGNPRPQGTDDAPVAGAAGGKEPPSAEEVTSMMNRVLQENGMGPLTAGGATGPAWASTAPAQDAMYRNEMEQLSRLTEAAVGSLGPIPPAAGAPQPAAPSPATGTTAPVAGTAGTGALQASADDKDKEEEQAQERQLTPEELKEDRRKALKEAMDDLEALRGLDKVKEQIRRIAAMVKANQRRKELGIDGKNLVSTYHIVFTGRPGTGKTTVARSYAKMLYGYGILDRGQLVETDRSGLIAGYQGQTAIKVRKMVKRAMGGVLFIDEAYLLKNGMNDDYGEEAISTLLKYMEDYRDKFVVIVAGYEGPMEEFLDANPGLRSRFSAKIHFPDYNDGQLTDIYSDFARKVGIEITDSNRRTLAGSFHNLRAQDSFANGRTARSLFEQTLVEQSLRLETDGAAKDAGKDGAAAADTATDGARTEDRHVFRKPQRKDDSKADEAKREPSGISFEKHYASDGLTVTDASADANPFTQTAPEEDESHGSDYSDEPIEDTPAADATPADDTTVQDAGTSSPDAAAEHADEEPKTDDGEREPVADGTDADRFTKENLSRITDDDIRNAERTLLSLADGRPTFAKLIG